MSRYDVEGVWGYGTGARSRIASVLLHAFVVLISLACLFPVVVVLISSFSTEAFLRFPPHSFGLVGYASLIGDAGFWRALGVSALVAVVVTALSCILGIMAAYALVRLADRASGTMRVILLAPLSIPGILIGVGLLQLFVTAHLPVAPFGLMLGHLTTALPFMVSFVATGIQGSSERVEWASESLGASKWRSFTTVVLPVISPSVVGGAVFSFLHSFDEANISLFTAQGAWTTLPVKIFLDTADQPIVAAVESGVMIVIAAVGVAVLQARVGFVGLLLARNGVAYS